MSLAALVHLILALLMAAPGIVEFAWICLAWTSRG